MTAEAAGFAWDPGALLAALEDAGFDVDARQAATPEGGGVLLARRERGDETKEATIDAGGRVRATVTRVVTESSRAVVVGGEPMRMITTVQRSIRLAGTLRDLDRLVAFLAELDRLPGEDVETLQSDAPGGPW